MNQMIIDHNNLASFETWIFFKWIFKTFVAVTLITNTFNIMMAVFDVSRHVINNAEGRRSGSQWQLIFLSPVILRGLNPKSYLI